MFEDLLKSTAELSKPKTIERLIIEELKEFEPEIIDLNQEQLESGELSTGERTPEYASKDYEKAKKAQGSKSGKYWDLKVDGDFYQGMNIEFKGDSIWYDSSDDKANSLENDNRAGSDIYGLNDKNKNEIAGEIASGFIDRFNKILL